MMLVRGMHASEVSGSDPGLVSALVGASLPTDDLTEAGRTFFAFRDESGDDVLGYGGVETFGTVALLRSVVVAKDRRGQGIGARLIEWLLGHLRANGCREVYMLTTTAVSLGARCGFKQINRAAAPPFIRDSRQMAALCPSTAVLMARSL